MAKLLLALVCSVLLFSKGYAQDLIIRTDSVQIKAQVLEIGMNQIRFRRSESSDTLEYLISTRDVLEVQLADGTRRTFAQTVRPALPTDYYNYEKEWGRNLLTFSLTDAFISNVTLAYERYSSSGKVGVKIPLAVGLETMDDYNVISRRTRNFGAGISLNFYPKGQGRFRYYLGPMVDFSIVNFNTFHFDNNSTMRIERNSAQMYTFGFNNGMYYHLTPSLLFVLDVPLALRRIGGSDNVDYYFYEFNRTKFVIPLSLQLGYRF